MKQPITPPSDKEAAFAKAADAYFTEVLNELGAVPGLGVAVVKDDKPIYVKGHGPGDSKVDANTNFYIASCTKAYTALLAQHLDQKGIINLDAPITKYLPAVSFDPELEADKVLIRDLLTHTSGLQHGPITHRLAYSGEHSHDQLIELLEYTKPNKAGRGQFQYSNFGYNLYTIISDKVTGKPWQDWLEEVIFEPSGMSRTSAYMSHVERKGWKLAPPYMNLIGEPHERVALIKTDQSMQSAGGLITTPADAARWLELQLNEGKLDGKQVIPAEHIEASHQPLAKTGREARSAFTREHYGFGWRIGQYNGHPNINHFGGYPGYLTHYSFDPETKIGLAIFANEGFWGDNVIELFASFVYDWWYGDPEAVSADYQEKKQELLDHCRKVSEKIAEHQEERAERQWKLEKPFAAYSGTYLNELVGTVRVQGDEEGIEVQNGNLHCVAAPYSKKNTIRVELIPGNGMVMAFEQEDGKIVGLEVDGYYFGKVARR